MERLGQLARKVRKAFQEDPESQVFLVGLVTLATEAKEDPVHLVCLALQEITELKASQE